MGIDVRSYNKAFADEHICNMYSGPLWAGGIDGMAEMLQKRLEFDRLPLGFAQSVFSIFIEQLNNMLMYSAEKEDFPKEGGGTLPVPKGTVVFGTRGNTYFFLCGNVVTAKSAAILKERIDYLNTLDKKELRAFYKERLRSDNTNDESKGAGLGLIEIARRASSKITYEFTPERDGLSYYTMHVSV